MAMIVADGPTGRADPAYEAHEGPIRTWAMVVYESWLPPSALNRLAAHARRLVTTAKNVWGKVTGPASGCFATAARIGWTMQDACCFITDLGRHLDLRVDPLGCL